jgi:hypothetical protein
MTTDANAATEAGLARHFQRVRRCGNGWVALCPHHDDHARSLSIGIGEGGRLLLYCHASCSFIEIIKASGIGSDDLDGLVPPTPRSSEEIRAHARRIWKETCRLAGTAAEKYLHDRGVNITAASLRFHPHLASTEIREIQFPALVAGIQAPDGSFAGIQATWIAADGAGKVPAFLGVTPRKIFGHRAAGAVRLAPATSTLCLAEGIETGLSVLQATGIPTWATLGTSGLKSIKLPPMVRDVVIAADADAPGIAAANFARRRFMLEGRRVRIALPPEGSADFNEVSL